MAGKRTIRRSLIAQRDAAAGVPRGTRRERVRTLRRLFALFDENDAAEEVRRLKLQDQDF